MRVYSELTDQELTGLLKLDDEGAFRFIYDKYWDKLLFVAGKKLNDQHEAEEITQDIFLNLWKKRNSFELKTGFDNYLAVAVKYEVFKRRALRAKRQQFIADANTTRHLFPQSDIDPYAVNEIQQQLALTVNTLPPQCRLIFTMSRNEGLPNKNIAQNLNISEKAVEKQITHALKVIKKRFGRMFSLFTPKRGHWQLVAKWNIFFQH